MNEGMIDKLRKVLNLANKGATQGEMEAALARAKEIAMRYNIDLADIDLADPNERKKAVQAEVQQGQVKSRYWRKHHRWICSVVEKVFGVRIIRCTIPRGSREEIIALHMIGESNDIAVATIMLKWLDELFPEAFKEQVRLGYCRDTAEYIHGYYKGLYWGLMEANKRKEEEVLATTDANKYALVVRSKELAIAEMLAKAFPDMKEGEAPKVKKESQVAVQLGYQKGRTIKLNQVGPGKNNSALK